MPVPWQIVASTSTGPESELLALALELADKAGALLLGAVPRRAAGVGTKTTGTDMVTDADRASEALITEGIRAARPGDAILGEEGGASTGTTGVRWVIDPLDGTTNYLYGHFAWAVSIAVEVDGVVVAGVVADPSHAETFAAQRGAGATCNGVRIAASSSSDLATALIATGFGYEASHRARQATPLPQVLEKVRDLRRNGAASLDLCWVACGRLDAYYETGLQPWDTAAGLLIASEAGAHTSDLAGGVASSASCVAAGAGSHRPLLELLAGAGVVPVDI